MNPQLHAEFKNLVTQLTKQGFAGPMTAASGDPALMGAPPAAPPMDPAMAGGGMPPGMPPGAPPMDPAMAGGMPPGAAPMPPAAPPMPPGGAQGGNPTGMTPEDIRAAIQEGIAAAMGQAGGGAQGAAGAATPAKPKGGGKAGMEEMLTSLQQDVRMLVKVFKAFAAANNASIPVDAMFDEPEPDAQAGGAEQAGAEPTQPEAATDQPQVEPGAAGHIEGIKPMFDVTKQAGTELGHGTHSYGSGIGFQDAMTPLLEGKPTSRDVLNAANALRQKAAALQRMRNEVTNAG